MIQLACEHAKNSKDSSGSGEPCRAIPMAYCTPGALQAVASGGGCRAGIADRDGLDDPGMLPLVEN